MITPRIEKAILSGWATYRKINHAFSSFGSIAIPKGHTAIILDISWHHFIDVSPKPEFSPWLETLENLQKYSEYQLKIDGKKSLNYLEYRNIFKFVITNPRLAIDITEPFSAYELILNKYILPIHSQPIQKDVFFVCENYINLSITKNVYINNVNDNYTQLNPKANQPPTPNGLGNLPVTTAANFFDPLAEGYQLIPTLRENTGGPYVAPIGDQIIENYNHPISKVGNLSTIVGNQPFLYNKTPLIELGIVIFNSNDFDKIANQ
jgi:hypothetical protein